LGNAWYDSGGTTLNGGFRANIQPMRESRRCPSQWCALVRGLLLQA